MAVSIFVLLFSVAGALNLATASADTKGTCDDKTFLTECPSQCADRCRDSRFFDKNDAACEKILLNPPNKAHEPAFCSQSSDERAAAIGSDRLRACLARAKSGRTFKQRIAENLQGFPEDFAAQMVKAFETFPVSCAPDVNALVSIFKCLEQEGSNIQTTFDGLKGRGYGVLEGNQICKVSYSEIKSDMQLSTTLETRGKDLLGAFSSALKCRNEIEKWIDDSATIEINSESFKRGLQDILSGLKSQLTPSTRMQIQVSETLDKIRPQIADIKGIVFRALVICPDKG